MDLRIVTVQRLNSYKNGEKSVFFVDMRELLCYNFLVIICNIFVTSLKNTVIILNSYN
jgi:hypothetical protein